MQIGDREVALKKAFLSTLREIRGFVTTAEARRLAVPLDNDTDQRARELSGELEPLGPGLTELVRLHDASERCEGHFDELERLEYHLLAELFSLGLLHTTPEAPLPLEADTEPLDDDDVDDHPSVPEVGSPADQDADVHRDSLHQWVQERQTVLAEPGLLTVARIDRWRADPASPPRHALVAALLVAARGLPNISLDADRRLALTARLSEWQTVQTSLVLHNIRLAAAHVYRRRGALSEREALLSGIAGLQTAVRRFEVRMGYRFSTYGTVWIRHKIQRADADFGLGIRTPVHDRDRIYRYFKMTEHIEPHLLAAMTAVQLSAQINMDVSEVLRVRALVRPTRTHLETSDSAPFAELFDDDRLRPSEAAPPPHEAGTLLELDRRLRIALEALGPREEDSIKARDNRTRIQHILVARLGLGSEGKVTLEELGGRYDVSRERIRQLETQGLEQLRKAIQKS